MRRALAPVVLTLGLVSVGAAQEAPRIHEIQGSGHRSPIADQEVRAVRGVVTAVQVQGRGDGFWIQDPHPDDDDATSEGLFVAAMSTVSSPQGDTVVALGHVVEVDGRVDEVAGARGELTITHLVPSAVRVLEEGRPLPAPVRLGHSGRRVPTVVFDDDALGAFEPCCDGIDFFESLEGMRVEIADAAVIGPTSRFGEFVVLADNGRDAARRSRRGGLLHRPGDENPERLVIASRLLAQPPELDVGARFEGTIVGVVHYTFHNFKILPDSLPAAARPGPPIDEATRLVASERQLTVATWNVFNLLARAAPEKLERTAAVVVRDLGAPDILGVQEIQGEDGREDDGTVDAGATFEALIAAVQAAGGPRYEFRQIDPVNNADGGAPGTNIRVGFLFDPARVTFVDRGAAGAGDANAVETGTDGPQLRFSPGRIAPGDPAFESSRKPLAGEFLFRGQRVFVIVNHLKSKRGDDRLMGATQPPRLVSEVKRSRQARLVHAFAEHLVDADADARVVMLGDMNDMLYRSPIRILAGSRFVNLIERVAEDERYTFIFNGNSQVLDHILISPALATRASPEVDVVHTQADVATSRRASDHDPVIVRLTFN